jgi:hypothetical protein
MMTGPKIIQPDQDWPSSKDFKDQFPELYSAFCLAIPMPDLTRPDGCFNMAAYFATNALKPDLGQSNLYILRVAEAQLSCVGPKMYIAYKDSKGSGSTRLHVDASDAINLMVHAEPRLTGYAEWIIFTRGDTDRLREFLKPRESQPPEDPIHGQKVFLTHEHLREISALGIVPYIVHQRVGETVFIPAGCAHQVRFNSSLENCSSGPFVY